MITEVRDDDGVPMAVVDTDSAAAVTACLLTCPEDPQRILSRCSPCRCCGSCPPSPWRGAGVVILLCWTLATHAHALTTAGWHQWSWALATGLILAANVAATYMALARVGAIDVTAIGVADAIITALLQGAPDTAGLALITAGAALALLAARPRPALAGIQ